MTDREKLLAEALGKEALADLEAKTLKACFKELKRNRNRNEPDSWFWIGAAACLLFLAGAIFLLNPPQPRPSTLTSQPPQGYPLGLRPPEKTYELVTEKFPPVEEIETRSGLVQSINEEDLLELFKGRPIALVSGQDGMKFFLLDE